MTGYIYSRWLTPTLQLSEVCCYCKSVIPLEMCLFAVFGEMSVFLCQNKKSAWEAETEHYKIIPSGRWAASLGSHFRLSTVQPSSAQITSVYEWVCVCVCLLYFQRYIQWSQNSNSKDNVHCTLPAYFLKHSKLKIQYIYFSKGQEPQNVNVKPLQLNSRLTDLKNTVICLQSVAEECRCVFWCASRHLVACTHPWRSAPPVNASWKASARPPSSPHVAPTRPAPPRCGRLTDTERDSFTQRQRRKRTWLSESCNDWSMDYSEGSGLCCEGKFWS